MNATDVHKRVFKSALLMRLSLTSVDLRLVDCFSAALGESMSAHGTVTPLYPNDEK
jgi:hypothetical protein